MTYRNRGFDPEQFFGPEGPFGPRGPLGPGGIFGPQGPFGTGGGWGQGFGSWAGEEGRRGQRGPGGPGGRARRARRGDVRNAVLHLLQREPMNGYQLMQEIAESTGGAWQPSSGAIYPALAQLEDEGLVEQAEVDGRKAYQLTDAGRQAAESGPALAWSSGEEPEDPWSGRGPRGARGERSARHTHGQGHGGQAQSAWRTGGTLFKALGSLAMATQAVGQAGDDTLTRQAVEVIDRARRDLYRMLAESEVERDDEVADEVADGEIIED
ncbi:PadR family transcriptional regulator [Ornithinimicrobium sp. LYQ103]|uniref:PadR family transcriptional regulator n=1 Tax=Ornithinimicrobium sp. LYQ103 TaxID=3378796 RepID=UPI0038539F79